MTSQVCENDFTFGPGADCRTLDFTLTFSNLFLSFVPALILTLLAVLRTYRVAKHKSRRLLPLREIPLFGHFLLWSRVIFAAALVGSSIALCISWEEGGDLNKGYSGTLASSFEVVSAVCIALLVILEHFRNARPSQLVALYLLVTLLFVASRLRTLALISSSPGPIVPLSISLAARLLLFIALQFSTRQSQIDGHLLPPERTAGLVSRYLVSWVMPLLWRGYRRPLGVTDLGTIDENLHSISTWNAFEPYWEKQSKRYHEGKTKQPLVWASMYAFGPMLAAPLFPYLISSVATLARPLIIGETVTFVESYDTATPIDLSKGWGLVGATALTYLVFGLAQALAHVATQRSALALRGAFMEALYRKSLVIRVETAREMGAAKASNLMSVDVNAIVQTVQALHSVWTALVMTALGLYIIWTQIGLSFLASVGGAVFFFAILPLITRKVGKTRTGWAESTDRRVKFMASVLRHIKAIKLSAYEPSIINTAVALRDEEMNEFLKWIKEILIVSTVTNYVANFLGLITVVTYTLVSLYTQGGEGVSTSTIFTVISTIGLLADPLRSLGQQLGSIVSAWASWKRIEDFLLSEERIVPVVEEGSGIALNDAPTENVRVRIDGSFGVKGGVTLVHDVQVDLENPGLWMIVGRVGSGKSVMLQALLDELDIMSGKSYCSLGTVGYCAQDPWLLNSSIRANITFMHPYDATWYRTVLSAVSLDVDLGILNEGDTTLVSHLSGGQKQRVALARAVYGKFNSYVLDDVFSALDATTEAHVFASLLGPQGLLKGKTVILATNQVYRLSQASLITCLDQGRIVEQGDYETLLAQGGTLTKLIQDFTSGSKAKQEEDTQIVQNDNDDIADDGRSDHSGGRETSAQGSVAWSTYGLYLKSMGWGHATIWLSMIVVTEIIQTCVNIYLQAWTTALKPSSPASAYGSFLGGYAGMQVGFLVSFVIAIFSAYMYAHPIVSRKLHETQIRGLMGVSLDYFGTRPIGQMINRFNSDLNMIDMTLPNHAVNTVYIATQVIGSCILIIVAGPYMAIVIVVTAIVMVLLQRFYVRAARELRRLDLTCKSPIYTLFTETIDPGGLRTVRAMRAEPVCRQMMTDRATKSQFPAWLLMVIIKWLELALNLCVACINVFLVLFAVWKRHSVSSGVLAVALTLAAAMTFNLMLLVVEWTNVEICITSVERIQEYIELPPQDTTPPTGDEWLHHGSIRLLKVSARYAPNLPPALSNVSFAVKPGQRVGICGRSGSGKSTLLGALWRLIDIEEGGEILVDGVDIRDLSLQDYRSAMSIVPQDPLLLELTLRENLDPEGRHSDAELWEALDKSHLKAHVEALELKLDQVMSGDEGVFSRGQRQLLALARALLRQRHILALDEATSSIDAETDAAIQNTIRTYFDNATVLTVAHRISTIIDYDVIIVMDQGRVVEIGEPGRLIEQQGPFWRLAVESGAVAVEQAGGSGVQ